MFRSEDEFKQLVGKLNINAEPDPVHREKLRRQMLYVFETASEETAADEAEAGTLLKPQKKKLVERIYTMKSLAKIAAAIIIVAGLAGLFTVFFPSSKGGSGVVFADMVQPILDARTVIFDVVIGKGDKAQPAMKIKSMGTNRIHQTLPNGMSGVIDYDTGKMLYMNPADKTAMFIEMSGLPEGKQNFMDMLISNFEKAMAQPGGNLKSLGEKEIEGKQAIGFHAALGASTEITLWSDVQSNIPIIIEFKGLGQSYITYKNFQFDVEMDEALFAMEVPEGYTLQETKLDLTGTTENDLLDSLRLWSDALDGAFPTKLDIGEFQSQGGKFKKMVDDLPETEQAKAGLQVVRGLIFLTTLKEKWHYAGAGVNRSDTDTPIFWYKPKDSETYRVIYGDLSVKDVAEEDLPEMP